MAQTALTMSVMFARAGMGLVLASRSDRVYQRRTDRRGLPVRLGLRGAGTVVFVAPKHCRSTVVLHLGDAVGTGQQGDLSGWSHEGGKKRLKTGPMTVAGDS